MGSDEQRVEIVCGQDGIRLDAAWRPVGAVGAVVGAPHPQYGGRMDDPVVVSMAAALADKHMATLRFDWRGVGNSSGAVSGALEDALVDYRAAVDFVSHRCGPRLVAAGYSYGAVAAVGTARNDERVGALLLVAPPVALLPSDFLVGLEVPVRILVGDCDHLSPLSVLERLASAGSTIGLAVIEGGDHVFSSIGAAALRTHALAAAESLGRALGAT